MLHVSLRTIENGTQLKRYEKEALQLVAHILSQAMHDMLGYMMVDDTDMICEFCWGQTMESL